MKTTIALVQLWMVLEITANTNQMTSEVSLSVIGGYCRDRFGLMEVDGFIQRSCSMCYMYLFPYPMGKELRAAGREFRYLISKNLTLSNIFVSPDPRNDSTMATVCSTLNKEECQRWRDCCQSAQTCCDVQQSMPQLAPENQGMCLRTWDGFSCWLDAEAGTTHVNQCPSFLGQALTTREAVKQCTVNGTWYHKGGLEWTDYTACLDKEGYLITVYLAIAFNAFSFLLLFPSVVIFCAFKGLYNQHRVKLHINFFISLGMTCVANILWYMLVHHDLLVNPESNATVMHLNPSWCRFLSFMKLYLSSSNYFWAFCEGFYLHRLISKAFEPPKTLVPLYLIGWGAPFLPIFIYSILRIQYENSACWTKSYGAYNWIIYAPNLICIVANLIFLCNIMRILLFQLHSHPHEPSNFRRGLKAAFMLIPLFGLQLFLTIYRPPPGTSGEKEYEYITMVITSSQGVFVSLIFCFFNGEVLAQLREKCPCCCCLNSRLVRRPSTQMTMVTVADTARSPTNSTHSRMSYGQMKTNGAEVYEMEKCLNNGSLTNCNVEGGSPQRHGGYCMIPTS